jgi:hypothetical protein
MALCSRSRGSATTSAATRLAESYDMTPGSMTPTTVDSPARQTTPLPGGSKPIDSSPTGAR